MIMQGSEFFVAKFDFYWKKALVGLSDKTFDPFKVSTGQEVIPIDERTFHEVKSGKRGVFLASDYPSLIFANEKVTACLEANDIKGWLTTPVIIITKKKERLTNYSLFSVTGKSGAPRFDFSRRTVIKPAVQNGYDVLGWQGFEIDESNWDGSDIFYPSGTSMFVCTKSARDAIQQIDADIQFMNISEYSTQTFRDPTTGDLIFAPMIEN